MCDDDPTKTKSPSPNVRCPLQTIKLDDLGCVSSNGMRRLHICEEVLNDTKHVAVLEMKMLASRSNLFGG